MSKVTKGTHIFFIDPDDGSVVRIPGITAFNPSGTPAEQIDVTDLEETQARRYKKGLAVPGQATATVNADPNEPAHIRLHQLAEAADDENGPIVKFAIGWSDGNAAPTADSNGDFVLPTSRTWYTFEGYVADFPFDFQLGAVVAVALSIQRSGPGLWTKKVA